MSDESPTAWSLGYQDGQLNRPMWRKVLKDEYLAEYDSGFWDGQLRRRLKDLPGMWEKADLIGGETDTDLKRDD